MHRLYDLKDKLMEELESYADVGKISKDAAMEIKCLASALDHLCNVCEDMEDESSYDDGMTGTHSYSRRYPRSFARGRMNARRDSMGRYSRADGQDGNIEDIKRDARRLADKVEQM